MGRKPRTDPSRPPSWARPAASVGLAAHALSYLLYPMIRSHQGHSEESSFLLVILFPFFALGGLMGIPLVRWPRVMLAVMFGVFFIVLNLVGLGILIEYPG